MKNPEIPKIASGLRAQGFEVFDDWHCTGPDSDLYWYHYERARPRAFVEALQGAHAKDVFAFDKRHLDISDVGVLVLPAGKSGHLELGYVIGKGKRGYILLDKEPERFDVMYGFADGVFYSVDELLQELLLWQTRGHGSTTAAQTARTFWTYAKRLTETLRKFLQSPAV